MRIAKSPDTGLLTIFDDLGNPVRGVQRADITVTPCAATAAVLTVVPFGINIDIPSENVTIIPHIDVESFAQVLHEAGREAVEKGATVAADKFGEKTRTFMGWDEISESAREGRRIQARYLLSRFDIVPK